MERFVKGVEEMSQTLWCSIFDHCIVLLNITAEFSHLKEHKCAFYLIKQIIHADYSEYNFTNTSVTFYRIGLTLFTTFGLA